MNWTQPLRLLPSDALLRTGEVDHADWNHRPLLGAISRVRYRMVRSLLAGQRARRLLEIGYGSGVFMPELSRYCQELYGIDPHPRREEIERVLSRHGVAPRLHCGSATAMPWPWGFFDTIVAVSTLEFVSDIAAACREIKRVLSAEGKLIVVTPSRSRLADWGLRILTGENAARDYQDRREALLPALTREFAVGRELRMPPAAPGLLRLYTAYELRPVGDAGSGRITAAAGET